MRSALNLVSLLGSSALIVTVVVSLSGCSRQAGVQSAESAVAIVNGEKVRKNDPLANPTVAILIGERTCSGVVIDERIVLSAAHCFPRRNASATVVFAQAVDSNGGVRKAEMIATKAIELHPEWDANEKDSDGDLAVLLLEHAAPRNTHPAVILPASYQVVAGEWFTAAGFGDTSPAQAESEFGIERKAPLVLRKTKLQITKWLNETEVESDGRKTSPCFGDSGGPAFIDRADQTFVWGVDVRSGDAKPCRDTVTHTALQPHLEWIETTKTMLLSKTTERAPAMVGAAEVAKEDPVAASTVGIYLTNGLTKKRFKESYCSGTLIAPNLVLTAAHCFDRHGMQAKAVKFFGQHRTTGSVRGFEIIPGRISDEMLQRLIAAGQPTPEGRRDLAVIFLNKPAPASAVVVPLSQPGTEIKEAQTFIVAGVGQSKPVGKVDVARSDDHRLGDSGEGKLRKDSVIYAGPLGGTQLKMQNALELPCSAVFSEQPCAHDQAREAMLEKEAGGPCVGDSGGPVFNTIATGALELIGVMRAVYTKEIPESYDQHGKVKRKAEKFMLCNSYTYVTPIEPYLPWIQSMIERAKSMQ